MARDRGVMASQARYVFPARIGPLGHLGRLIAHRELLFLMVVRDLKARYTQSMLGLYWAVINPLVHALVFTAAFSIVVRVDVGDTPYFLFVLTGLLAWNLLSHGVADATESFVEHDNLVTKMPFPREVIPLSSVLARILDLVFSLLVLIVIMAVLRWPLHPHIMVVLPLVGLQVLFVSGIGLCTSMANLFYRDVRQLVVVGLPLWMYLSPIIYPPALVPEHLQGLYKLNPMVGLVNAYRAVLLHGALPLWTDLLPVVAVTLVLLGGGYWWFKKLEPQFAEVV
jgi:ABC-type polysaccharide/polyol phosphate export permease